MTSDRHRDEGVAEKAAWPLLFLTAGLLVYLGLSAVAYMFMGVPTPASGLGEWTAAVTGGLQAVVAIAAIVLGVRRDLRGATLAVAGSILLGWASTLPSVAAQGIDFRANGMIAPLYVVAPPLVAIAAAVLAWRNPYPVAAALVASAMTAVGILFVIVFGIIIAIHGF